MNIFSFYLINCSRMIVFEINVKNLKNLSVVGKIISYYNEIVEIQKK